MTLKAVFYLFIFLLHNIQVSDLDDDAGSPTEEFKAFAGDSGMNRSQSEYCNVGSKTSLTNHPAKKYVFDFMRVLIMDNMCMTPASKQTPIVDMLLEVRRSTWARTDVTVCFGVLPFINPSCIYHMMFYLLSLVGFSRALHQNATEGVPVQHPGQRHGASSGCRRPSRSELSLKHARLSTPAQQIHVYIHFALTHWFMITHFWFSILFPHKIYFHTFISDLCCFNGNLYLFHKC